MVTKCLKVNILHQNLQSCQNFVEKAPEKLLNICGYDAYVPLKEFNDKKISPDKIDPEVKQILKQFFMYL